MYSTPTNQKSQFVCYSRPNFRHVTQLPRPWIKLSLHSDTDHYSSVRYPPISISVSQLGPVRKISFSYNLIHDAGE